MKTITLAGKRIKIDTIVAYVTHLRKEDIGDQEHYEHVRRILHNTIFLEAGFWNIGKCSARVIQKDSEFTDNLNTLLCRVLSCPIDGHGTVDRNNYCFMCGRFITLEDNINTLRKIADGQIHETKRKLEN